MRERLRRQFVKIAGALAAASLAVACGGSSGTSNAGVGQGSSFTLVSVQWGRFVNIYDASGAHSGVEVIGAEFKGDGSSSELRNNPVSGHAELHLLAANAGEPSFFASLEAAKQGLVSVQGLGPVALGGYAMIPRNAGIRVHFNTPVDPATLNKNTLRFVVGGIPFEPGVLAVDPYDPFVVFVNPVVLAPENAALGINMNPTGFPPSSGSLSANLLLRIPTLIQPSMGQNELLRDADGKPAIPGNLPSNPVTQAIEIYFRSGGAGDPSNGFLTDAAKPRILGSRLVQLDQVTPLGQGLFDIDFSLTVGGCALLPIQLGDALVQGEAYGLVEEILSNAPAPLVARVRASNGSFQQGGTAFWKTPYDEATHASMKSCFVTITGTLGGATPASSLSVDSSFVVEFSKPMDPASLLPFRSFALTNQDGGAVADLALPPSEPGGARWNQFVVGRIEPSSDLRSFEFLPVLPLNASAGKRYDLHLAGGAQGVRDLAGNALSLDFPFVVSSLSLAPGQSSSSESRTCRFLTAALDENDDGIPEVNAAGQGLGQGTFDAASGGGIRGRSATVYSASVDPNQPFVNNMAFLSNTSLQTPLVEYGARLMTLYRPQDIFGGTGGLGGPTINAKDTWNVDVVGLSWCPAQGNVLPDQFGRFDGFLGHALYSPVNRQNPFANFTDIWQYTGLNPLTGFNPFDSQALETASVTSGGVVIGMGRPQLTQVFGEQYDILPSSKYTIGGTTFFPYKSFVQSFTWRDLTLVEESGPNVGIPYLAGGKYTGPNPGGTALNPVDEFADPSELEVVAPGSQQKIYKLSKVNNPSRSLPSIALPLLMDFKCYNNQQTPVQAQAKNSFAISIMFTTTQGPGTLSYIAPATRCFTQGGPNSLSGGPNWVDPGQSGMVPKGGWNPTPPAGPTFAFDNTIYHGRVDMQNKKSIFFSRWIETGLSNPQFGEVVMEPDPALFPNGTQILFEFRGASMVPSGSGALDARRLDPYGNCDTPSSNGIWACNLPPAGMTAWKSSLQEVDGFPFVQMRVTLVANPTTMVSPTLRAVGITFQPGN